MSRLRELEEKFKKKEISKDEYIKKIYELHTELWNYSEFIKGKNINSINISEEGVLFETKNKIKLVFDTEDERATPLEILNFGDYESEEIRMINKFIKEDNIILDIGANIGWYSINLAAKVPHGKVIAFEPIPKTFSYLKKNIALNNIKNIEAYNFGLSDKEEILDFYYDPKLTGATSLRNLHEDREKTIIKCEVKRMDDVVPDLVSKVDFIKCDVEGAELFVVKGGIETIKREKPVIFLEMLRKWAGKFGYHPKDIILILKDMGYNCYCVENGKLLKIDEVNDETTATNFFFIPSEKEMNE